jgi:hypothetical protein
MARSSYWQSVQTVLRTGFRALEITVFVSASFHLALVAVAAFLTRDIRYLNPMAFLGIYTVFPAIGDSRLVFAIAWLSLIGLYAITLVLIVSKGLQLQLRFVQTIKTKREELRHKLNSTVTSFKR